MTAPRVFTVKEVAAYLRVHTSTVYRLVRANQLPGFRIGSDWRFNIETIKKWVRKRGASVARQTRVRREWASKEW